MNKQTKAIVNGKMTFKMAWQRAKKYNAIPIWARKPKSRRKILAIYIEAQNKNLQSRTKHQVDHIVPLYHRLVCGLHTPDNLQILTRTQNQNKSNYFYSYREILGKKYYYNKPKVTTKPSKRYNPTKKNPRKLAKRRIKNKRAKIKVNSG